jgi:hypothetical protein
MTTDAMAGAIPDDVARQLCDEIRNDNRGKWWRWTAWWCWGCDKASKGDPAKRCWYGPPRNRGCAQVNQRYE